MNEEYEKEDRYVRAAVDHKDPAIFRGRSHSSESTVGVG